MGLEDATHTKKIIQNCLMVKPAEPPPMERADGATNRGQAREDRGQRHTGLRVRVPR